MQTPEIAQNDDDMPEMTLDSLVESASAAARMLADARTRNSESTNSLVEAHEVLGQRYLQLGQEFDEARQQIDQLTAERDAARSELQLLGTDHRKLMAAFEFFVTNVGTQGERMIGQNQRVNAAMELYRSKVRYGEPAPVAADAPRAARPKAAAPVKETEASRPIVLPAAKPAVSIEDQINSEIHRTVSPSTAQDRPKPVVVAPAKPAPVVQAVTSKLPVPSFLTRRREEPAVAELEPEDQAALSKAASGFGGVFSRKRSS